MGLPVVIREEIDGFRKFSTYWQSQVVEAAIFGNVFYRAIQRFSSSRRLACYQLAVNMSQQYDVLITISDRDSEDSVKDHTYTVWMSKWDYLMSKQDPKA